uniref:NADH dehydrogenase subunit 3 n=1 Tax=Tritoniopsis elegans TaxID=1707732 RepID=UPI002551FDCE|nr:NADH dehydrogenase subunit 3 [Tritoniopsis elegans]WGM82657.1 NADH dehydrogenase subunit 3 [Tritoniopsis elegans]
MFAVSFAFALILSAILAMVYMITSYISYSDFSEKLTPFECGFDPLSKMRSPFSTRFFLLVVLFLIFDVEIALLFPVLSSLSMELSIILLFGLAGFLLILLIGMFHEWKEGALDWVSS